MRVIADAGGGLKDQCDCTGPYGSLRAEAANKRTLVYTGALPATTQTQHYLGNTFRFKLV